MDRRYNIVNIFGWLLLVSTFKPLALIIIGAKLKDSVPEANLVGMGLVLLPPLVLTGLGAIALILRRIEGAFAIYAAFLFTGLVGMNYTFIPLVTRLLPSGPYAADYVLALNCLIIALLAFIHWRNRNDGNTMAHRSLILGLVLLGMAAHGYARMQVQHLDGKGNLQELSFAALVAPLSSDVPVEHRVVVTGKKNIMGVLSGETSEASIVEFAQAHELKTLEYSEKIREKIIPLAKSWKLDEARFPRDFSRDDRFYIGRVKGHQKLIVQLAWRKADQRYTVMLMGSLSPL